MTLAPPFDSSFLVALASVVVAIAAYWIAKRTLDLAAMDWRQRKWVELYFKGNDVYDLMDRFQTNYPDPSLLGSDQDCTREFNFVMSTMRSLHTMAVVFPRNPEVDKLTDATAIFGGGKTHLAFSKIALNNIAEALEGIRQRCLLETRVLEK